MSFCGTHLGNEKVKEEADLTDNMLNQSDASPSMDKIDNTFEYGVDSPESKKIICIVQLQTTTIHLWEEVAQ